MPQSLHPAAEIGFSVGAELYQQARPSYPQSISKWLLKNLHLSNESKLIDLGAGTGKFIPYLSQISTHVIAIEPIQAMLQQLQNTFPEITTLQAYSHSIPLPTNSVDAVFCAQSFHWFANTESLNEIARLLKSGQFLILIWNQRDTTVNWVQAIAEQLSPLEGNTPRFHHFEWKEVLDQHPLFKSVQQEIIPFEHSGTVEQVVLKRLRSTSFIAALPTNDQQKFENEIAKIVLDYTGKLPHDHIQFPYQTHIYVYQKNGHGLKQSD